MEANLGLLLCGIQQIFQVHTFSSCLFQNICRHVFICWQLYWHSIDTAQDYNSHIHLTQYCGTVINMQCASTSMSEDNYRHHSSFLLSRSRWLNNNDYGKGTLECYLSITTNSSSHKLQARTTTKPLLINSSQHNHCPTPHPISYVKAFPLCLYFRP